VGIDLLSVLLVIGSIGAWVPIYMLWIIPATAKKSRDHMVRAIEKGEIDLNYLLEDVVDEIVIKVKQHALADLGNLTRAGLKPEEGLEPIQLSEMVLKGVGLTKPGPMLTVKMAQVLGTLADRLIQTKKETTTDENSILPDGTDLFSP